MDQNEDRTGAVGPAFFRMAEDSDQVSFEFEHEGFTRDLNAVALLRAAMTPAQLQDFIRERLKATGIPYQIERNGAVTLTWSVLEALEKQDAGTLSGCALSVLGLVDEREGKE